MERCLWEGQGQRSSQPCRIRRCFGGREDEEKGKNQADWKRKKKEKNELGVPLVRV